MASKRQTRATAAPLLVVFGIIALLYGFIALKKWDFEPRLGLDLQGGTSVILGPRATTGGSVSSGSVNKAVDIIRRRVNGFGVAESDVKREGDNIVVSIPGGDRDQVAQASRTAQLRFRMVQQATSGAASPAPDPSASADPSGSVSPSVSGSPSASPSGSATASATPSGSASGSGSASPTSTATTTANPRPLTSGVRAQSATETLSPTASPSPSPAPTASGSAAPSESPSPSAVAEPTQPAAPLPPGAEEAFTTFASLDCVSDDPAAVAARKKAAEADADPTRAIATCSEDGTEKYLLGPADMTGTEVKGATALIDPNGSEWIVNLELTGAGSRKFAELTSANVNQRFAIVLDGLVVSAPNINEAITGGEAQISGSFTKKSANDLANVLKYGALPLSFDVLSLDSISPSLGKESLNAGMLAGFIGLAAVLLYIIAYYRGLGLVTVVGLALWSAMNFALIIILGHAIGFTLTLAGIAGFIISAGITSDSYIVYFERLKDEAREGRSIQSSADRGFGRAFKTIVAANTVSFLAAVILYRFSAGAVRGFAFTLGLSTLLDLFLAYMFTRPIVAALSRTKLFSTGRFVGIKGSVPIAERAGRTRQTKEA